MHVPVVLGVGGWLGVEHDNIFAEEEQQFKASMALRFFLNERGPPNAIAGPFQDHFHPE